MGRISAASNLVIETQANHWRLLLHGNNGVEDERILLEAREGEPLRYLPSFGARRKLPDTGELHTGDVERVVLGYSAPDVTWRLGLVFQPALAEARGSRWCEIARWVDPTATLYRDDAEQAGETLAQTIRRPFMLIPPRADESVSTPVAVEAPAPPAPPLPDLPLKFDHWTMSRLAPTRYELRLSPSWGRGQLLRAAWYILGAGVFFVLSLSSLTSGIALPRPEILVPLGFVSSAVLLIAALVIMARVATRAKTIIVDSSGVRWMRGDSVQRDLPAEDLQGVFVSHLVSPRKSEGDARVHYGELNLYRRDGGFSCLIVQTAVDHKQETGFISSPESGDTLGLEAVADQAARYARDDRANRDAVIPLTPANVQTHLQAAGFLLAEALAVPAWFDRRAK
jgi:hypothetical protein